MQGADRAWRSHSWLFIAVVVCGQIMSGIDAAILRAAFELEHTFRVLSGCRKVEFAVGCVARGVWLA